MDVMGMLTAQAVRGQIRITYSVAVCENCCVLQHATYRGKKNKGRNISRCLYCSTCRVHGLPPKPGGRSDLGYMTETQQLAVLAATPTGTNLRIVFARYLDGVFNLHHLDGCLVRVGVEEFRLGVGAMSVGLPLIGPQMSSIEIQGGNTLSIMPSVSLNDGAPELRHRVGRPVVVRLLAEEANENNGAATATAANNADPPPTTHTNSEDTREATATANNTDMAPDFSDVLPTLLAQPRLGDGAIKRALRGYSAGKILRVEWTVEDETVNVTVDGSVTMVVLEERRPKGSDRWAVTYTDPRYAFTYERLPPLRSSRVSVKGIYETDPVEGLREAFDAYRAALAHEDTQRRALEAENQQLQDSLDLSFEEAQAKNFKPADPATPLIGLSKEEKDLDAFLERSLMSNLLRGLKCQVCLQLYNNADRLPLSFSTCRHIMCCKECFLQIRGATKDDTSKEGVVTLQKAQRCPQCGVECRPGDILIVDARVVEMVGSLQTDFEMREVEAALMAKVEEEKKKKEDEEQKNIKKE